MRDQASEKKKKKGEDRGEDNITSRSAPAAPSLDAGRFEAAFVPLLH